ncbi:hypothetical protein L7U65_26525, partial [Klebsiella pneumoniae]|nr:hypothetical protein [Klebsiella pneumoniae]
ATTLQLFGTTQPDGSKAPFDVYSMKQAIEEGFILDVLNNYTTYKTYYRLNKAVEEDPELKTTIAKRKIAKFVELSDENIDQKIEIIMDHFISHDIMAELGGHGKAMIVTLIQRQFEAANPMEKCYTDVTEFAIPNSTHKLYLSPVLDGFNSEIIAYNLSTSPNLEQVKSMLDQSFTEEHYENT